MRLDSFAQRKKDILSKKDKSSKGNWDKKIIKLCDKINSKENYYTTSSCSGRILIMHDSNIKKDGLFEFVSHEIISLENLKKVLSKIKILNFLKFKQEPCILHIACKTLEDASSLLMLAQKASFKKVGILSLHKNIIVEIKGSHKIEFPIIKDKRILVNNEFLEIVLAKANKNLEKSEALIRNLENLL